jgi:hypothetical protein
MFEELTLLKEIVGDLSSVGGWIAGGWIIYKVLVNMTLIIGGGWLVKTVAQMIANHCKAGISKSEGDCLQSENRRLKSELDSAQTKWKSEIERVKHMYKILKEKKEEEPDVHP